MKEDTLDWYAQDADGNIWYMGEDTKEYKNGKVSSTKGSWEAGVDGAQAGIIVPAHPQPAFPTARSTTRRGGGRRRSIEPERPGQGAFRHLRSRPANEELHSPRQVWMSFTTPS